MLLSFKNRISVFFEFIKKHPLTECIVLSALLYFIMESLCRHSLKSTLLYLVFSPTFYLINMLFVFITLSIGLFFKKRYFIYSIFTVLWLIMAITDSIVLSFRAQPFSASDFNVIKSAFTVVPIYIGYSGIILIIAAFILAVIGFVLLWKKSPKAEINLKKSLVSFAASSVLLVFLIFSAHTAGIIPREFTDVPKAFENYGFILCFGKSVFDTGIDQPTNYDKPSVESIISQLDLTYKNPQIKPNIIMLQLESFFDVNYLEDLELNKNPLPVFTSLKENYPSGFLTVTANGGGTANTEFEVITCMNLLHFGIGEYPFTTILDSKACPSTATSLRKYGYKSHSLHNHIATFYNRHKVYANLGFDTFTSIEYMMNPEFNSLGWAKDSILEEEIINALKSTKEQDYIYAISVQAHGRYPDTVNPGEFEINGSRYKDIKGPLSYYINEISEVDAFLASLTNALNNFEEPTVLVLYGDHLPCLDISKDDLKNKNLFQTEYVIWSNFDLKADDMDCHSHELSAHVFDILGLSGGIIPEIQLQLKSDSNFDKKLKIIEYDILYGSNHTYNDEVDYNATDIKLGINDISINKVTQIGGRIVVDGNYFTEYSYIFINGKKHATTYISSDYLYCSGTLNDGDVVTVVQVCNEITNLSSTDKYIYSQ